MILEFLKDSQDWPQLQKFENRSYIQAIVAEEKPKY